MLKIHELHELHEVLVRLLESEDVIYNGHISKFKRREPITLFSDDSTKVTPGYFCISLTENIAARLIKKDILRCTSISNKEFLCQLIIGSLKSRYYGFVISKIKIQQIFDALDKCAPVKKL